MVVDAASGKVYGHVVATSPFGEVYIIPLHNTLKQIRTAFGTDDVCLADPTRLLSQTILSAVESGQQEVLRIATDALSSLIRTMQDTGERPPWWSCLTKTFLNRLLRLAERELKYTPVRFQSPLPFTPNLCSTKTRTDSTCQYTGTDSQGFPAKVCTQRNIRTCVCHT